MVDQELVKRLVALIEAGLSPKEKPVLRVVSNTPPIDTFSELTAGLSREAHCAMIHGFVQRWGTPMQDIVDRFAPGRDGLALLPDAKLSALHQELRRKQASMRAIGMAELRDQQPRRTRRGDR